MERLIFIFISLSILAWNKTNAQDLSNISSETPVGLSGNIRFGIQSYSSNGINRSSPFSWLISGNPSVNVYGVEFPFSFTVGKMKKDASVPSFKQFGLSPTYKSVTLHIGNRNLHYSDYTMRGITFFGGGVEFNLKKIRLAALYGRFGKRVDEEENIEDQIFDVAYQRKGYGFKMGFGKKSNSIDFIYLKIKEDSLSIRRPIENRLVLPKENVALGLIVNQEIYKKFTFYLDAGLSAYTRNGFSNDVTVTDEFGFTSKLFRPKFSSRVSSALKSGFKLKFQSINLGIEYERIDPGYKTLGAYYFNNDFTNIVGKIGFSAFGHKLAVQSSVGTQSNNLRESHNHTTNRWITNLSAQINLNKHFGISSNYSNYSVDQTEGRVQLNDTIITSNISKQISVNPYFRFGSSKRINQAFISLSNFQTINNNEFDRGGSNLTAHVASGMYNLGFANNKTVVKLGVHYNRFQTSEFSSKRYGYSLGLRQKLWKDRLSINLKNTSSYNNRTLGRSGLSNVFYTDLSYRTENNHSIQCRFIWNKKSHGAIAQQFNEARFSLNYNYHFKSK